MLDDVRARMGAGLTNRLTEAGYDLRRGLMRLQPHRTEGKILTSHPRCQSLTRYGLFAL
jgi:hypothetical protein